MCHDKFVLIFNVSVAYTCLHIYDFGSIQIYSLLQGSKLYSTFRILKTKVQYLLLNEPTPRPNFYGLKKGLGLRKKKEFRYKTSGIIWNPAKVGNIVHWAYKVASLMYTANK